MRRRIIFPVFAILIFALMLCASAQVSVPASPVSDLQPGVVVENIGRNSEAEKAGIQSGDVILNWVRGDVKADITSPFDLVQIEIEQAPRGNVTLEGVRGLERRSWTLGPDVWGITARPGFQGKLLDLYQEGQRLSEAGKPSEAVARWQAAAEEARQSQIRWIGPWLLQHAAGALSNQKQYTDADDAYRRAVEMADTSSSLIRARVLTAWGDSARKRSHWENAERCYQQAIKEARQSGTADLTIAQDLDQLGWVAFNRGDLPASEDAFQQALAVRQKLAPESLPVSDSFTSLADLDWNRGNLPKAQEYLVHALHIREKLAPGSLKVAGSLHDLGRLAWSRGSFTEAEEYHRNALEIRLKLAPGSLDVGSSYEQLGILAIEHGSLEDAEEHLEQTLEIRQKLSPESPPLASVLNNLGVVAMQQGDFAKAENYYRQAVELGQRIAPGNPYLALGYINLGLVAMKQRHLAKADEYLHHALDIRLKATPESPAVAETFADLGDLAIERKDWVAAKRFYSRAMDIAAKISPAGREVAAIFLGLGDVAREQRDLENAERYFHRALEIWGALAPESVYYAESLASLGAVVRDRQQPDAAAHLFEQALGVLETQTRRLGGSQEIRSEFRARYSDYYQDYIELLIRQKQPEEAFHVAERWRAQSLLETLAAARVDIHQGADPELLEREHSLQDALNAKSDRRISLLTGSHTAEQVEAVGKEIEALRAEYGQVESRLRTTSPSYAALTRPQPLTSKEAQQLLTDDTLLLEYSLGEQRSYVWALTSSSLTLRALPGWPVIEAMARRMHKLASTLNSTGETESQAKQQRQTDLDRTASVLSQIILGPMARELKDKRLVIVADGALQYVPFGFLPEPGSKVAAPLMLRHEIVYSPSASVLAELRRDASGRVPPPKAVAVLADPVFDRDDPRVNANARAGAGGPVDKPSVSTQHLTRSAADVGLAHLPRLVFSRREADDIIALLPSGQGLEAVGFEANRTTATSADLAQYRVVHFATHALSDNQHPGLSGLVLSLVDPDGRPQNGFLDLQDIYNLKLPVDLVVLGACETALGKEIKGEGTVGLTRGFMYAGATRVISSLWNTDDESTKELMDKFYRGMELQGLSPAAALRSAQLAMWKQQRWRHPYYWAAFQVQGEWK
jgi:CHAT domain-containing protein/tetratricopeptide (TPR) repeat protein